MYLNHQKLDWFFIIFLVFYFLIAALSFHFQHITLINIDAANAIHEATVLYSGGKYFYDFYETTPPLFLTLYFPLAFILKNFPSIDYVTAYFAYYFVLCLVVMSITYFFSNLFFRNEQAIQKMLFLLLAAALLLLQPPYYFGQREYTTFILTLPYFLLFAIRLEKKSINSFLAVLIGLMAGCGFAIKPHFCLAFLLTELYLLFEEKSFLKIIRIENCLVYFVFIADILATLFLQPAYFHTIIPLTLKFYYAGIDQPFWSMFIQRNFIFSMLIVFFYYCLHKDSIQLSSLTKALLAAVLGFMFSYISERVPWDYHAFTFYAYSILLGLLLFFAFSRNKQHHISSIIFYFLLSALLFAGNAYYFWHFFDATEVIISLVVALCVFYASFLFEKYFFKIAIRYLSVLSFSWLVFAFPILTQYLTYQVAVDGVARYMPLMAFLKRFAQGKSVYYFSTILNYEYPVVDYAGALHSSRFCYLLWLPAYIKAAMQSPDTPKTVELYQINRYLTRLMARDIAVKKPEFILVDASREIKTPVFPVAGFNFVKFFSQEPEFRSVWQSYRLFARIHAEPDYTFDVYRLQQPKTPVVQTSSKTD